MIVRLFPSDRTGCGFYRCEEPGRVVRDGSDTEVQFCYNSQDDGGLVVNLAGPLGNEKVVQVADPECDVIVLQRPAHRHLVEAIPHLQAHGCAVVVDYDDDFDSLDVRNLAYAAYDPRHNPMSNKVWAKLASQLADLVTVTTPALAKRYGSHGRVVVIPNYVPERYLDVKPMTSSDDCTRIGWAGNPFSHPGDLEVMGDAIIQVVSDTGAMFRTVGSAETARLLGLSEIAEVIDWAPIDTFHAEVATFDVGLVPLRDSTFNRSKSWLKGLEYAALGVPFVASPTKPYQHLSELGAGDLVRTTTRNTGAWQDVVERLVTDAEYRRLRAEEGRIVARQLTYERHGEKWLTAWNSALSLRRAR